MAAAGTGPLTIDQEGQLTSAVAWAFGSMSYAAEIFQGIGHINNMEALAAQGEIAEGVVGTIGEASYPPSNQP